MLKWFIPLVIVTSPVWRHGFRQGCFLRPSCPLCYPQMLVYFKMVEAPWLHPCSMSKKRIFNYSCLMIPSPGQHSGSTLALTQAARGGILQPQTSWPSLHLSPCLTPSQCHSDSHPSFSSSALIWPSSFCSSRSPPLYTTMIMLLNLSCHALPHCPCLKPSSLLHSSHSQHLSSLSLTLSVGYWLNFRKYISGLIQLYFLL